MYVPALQVLRDSRSVSQSEKRKMAKNSKAHSILTRDKEKMPMQIMAGRSYAISS